MTQQVTVGKIDDRIPILGSADATWSLTTGVQPVVRTFDIPREALELVNRQRYAVRLQIGKTLYTSLSFVDSVPGPNPHIARVQLADRRYWWTYKHHKQFYNMRRRIGTKRRGTWQEQLRISQVPELQYAAYSTPDGKGVRRWGAVNILENVIEDVDPDANLIVQDKSKLNTIPVEDMDLDARGDHAINQALTKVPGSDLTISPSGDVIVFSWLSGKEVTEVGTGLIEVNGKLGPEIMGGGHVEKINHSATRPSAVIVRFTPEVEVRFDFSTSETEPIGGDVATQTDGKTPRRLENVLPVPDFELSLTTGETVTQGTYITFNQALDAWTAPPGILSQLNDEVIRRAFLPFRGAWGSLGLAGQFDLSGDDADWAARLAAIQSHYRQTFRIPKDWVDRTIDFRPYLAGTLDPTSGQRSPARAWADHAIRASTKGLFLQKRSREDKAWAFNVNGYPGDGSVITSSDKPAPAKIMILDPDQGVIEVNYHLDPYGIGDYVFPSKIEGIPAAPKDNRGREPICFGAIASGVKEGDSQVPRLAETQDVAVILTLIPAQGLYEVEADPQDVEKMLPDQGKRSQRQASGPPMYLRCPPSIETARIAWSDQNDIPDQIEEAFGIGQKPQNINHKLMTRKLRNQCINDSRRQGTISTVGGVLAGSLNNIAAAMAADVYSRHIDRVEGAMTGNINGNIIPKGAIEAVNHSISTQGVMTTSVSLRAKLPPIDMKAFLDPGTRRIVMKLVK